MQGNCKNGITIKIEPSDPDHRLTEHFPAGALQSFTRALMGLWICPSPAMGRGRVKYPVCEPSLFVTLHRSRNIDQMHA